MTTWASPVSSSDPTGMWTTPELAYDNDTGTKANGGMLIAIPGVYSEWLELNLLVAVPVDRVKFYADSNPNLVSGLRGIQVDVWQTGLSPMGGGGWSWQTVIDGDYAANSWVTQTFSGVLVSKARVRLYNQSSTPGITDLYEFMFGQIDEGAHIPTLYTQQMLDIFTLKPGGYYSGSPRGGSLEKSYRR